MKKEIVAFMKGDWSLNLEDPDYFISAHMERLKQEAIPYQDIRYIDQCGGGGYVTRLTRENGGGGI